MDLGGGGVEGLLGIALQERESGKSCPAEEANHVTCLQAEMADG